MNHNETIGINNRNTDWEKIFARHITTNSWYPKYTKIFVMLPISKKTMKQPIRKLGKGYEQTIPRRHPKPINIRKYAHLR